MKKIINIKRFERKFIFKLINQFEIQNLLFKSNFFFKPHYPCRKVNSIYFDTKSLKNINENLDGISDRKKFRVRWYGDVNLIHKPVFEIKYKNNFETSKKSVLLNIFEKLNLNNIHDYNELCNFIKKKYFKDNFIIPTCQISYDRIYLISANKLIRATIDFNIKSKKLMHFKDSFFRLFSDKILEIKYSTKDDKFVRDNISNINLRLMKSSKYINYSLNKSNVII